MITNLLSAMTMTKPGMVTIISYGNTNYYHFNHEFTEETKGKSKGNHPIGVSNLTIHIGILILSYHSTHKNGYSNREVFREIGT